MKKMPAPVTACIWVWLHFFPEAFSCLSVWSSSPCSFFPKTDPATYGILSEIIQEIFPVGGLCLGIFNFFLFILSCAWHQLQVLFLFWMERILSSIPKGPFGLFFFFHLICQKSFWWNILPWPPVWQDSPTCITLSRLKHEKHFENELCWSLGVISCQEIPKAFKPCLQLQSRKPRCYS